MSAILRLTGETIVLDKGQVVTRGPTPEAVDFYMTSEMARSGECRWEAEDAYPVSTPFNPIALRVLDSQGRVVNRVVSSEDCRVEFEYRLQEELTGLRVGIYLATSRGEPVFTTFDTDNPAAYESLTARPAGHYLSRCLIPRDTFNGGVFVLGVNASSFQIQSYFTDEHALTFTVDPTGAPGSHWAESRRGPIRPALNWEITEAVN